jgi:transcription-repair coupling factor (superfamily II helicase)
MIVDEEHRFGVRDKERISTSCRCGYAYAHSNPNSSYLNMAFSGMRDLSIIATPPARRLAVKTFVQDIRMTLKEAIA